MTTSLLIPEASTMRFAVIGCGVIGRMHAASIAEVAPEAELALAVDELPERARAIADMYGAQAATSITDALTRSGIDAVAICAPSGRHADLAIAALEAGKHVIVEKPLDVSLHAAMRVAKAERRARRTVSVISQHRFDPASQFVHQAVHEGRLGQVTSATASIAWWRSQDYYDSGTWRGTWLLDGGGALMNQGIHTIDLLVWMLGTPVEVFAWTDCLAHQDIEVEDTAVATIRFANGALGVIHGTTAAYPGLTARLQIHGDRGSAVIDDDRLAYFHAAGEDPEELAKLVQSDETPRTTSAGADPSALSNAHTYQYRDFLRAVSERRPPLVTVAEAITALATICAIYESAHIGRPMPVVLHRPEHDF